MSDREPEMRLLNDPRLGRQSTAQRWDHAKRPIAIIDGTFCDWLTLPAHVRGTSAYVVTTNEHTFGQLVERLDVEYLHLYEVRVHDLSPLSGLKNLRHLKIVWNTKSTDVEFLRGLTELRTLVLSNTPKIQDLSPVGDLKALTAFEFSGGIWTRNTCDSLRSVAALPHLEEVCLTNLTVKEGGLTPFAQSRSLKRLLVSHQFEVSDYALLSVALPHLECDKIVPWIRLDGRMLGGSDRWIVGRRGGPVNSLIDADRLVQCEVRFRKLQDEHRRKLGM